LDLLYTASEVGRRHHHHHQLHVLGLLAGSCFKSVLRRTGHSKFLLWGSNTVAFKETTCTAADNSFRGAGYKPVAKYFQRQGRHVAARKIDLS
jgi:hypothetical protein